MTTSSEDAAISGRRNFTAARALCSEIAMEAKHRDNLRTMEFGAAASIAPWWSSMVPLRTAHDRTW
jgi:hypothetical protein